MPPLWADLQPNRTHERQGIAVLDDARAHAIVESHLAILEPVFEVDVHDRGRQLVGDLGQGQVMRGHQADRAQVDQAADDPFGAHAAIVRVGAVEELVEQEQERQRPARQVDHLPHPGDLGVKPRAARLQRILDAQRGTDRDRREHEAGPHAPGHRPGPGRR